MTTLQRIAVQEAGRIYLELEPVFPVCISEICVHLGIQYRERTMSPHVDGFYYVTEEGTPYVFVNNHFVKYMGRRRFTGGHEVGHCVLSRVLAGTDRYHLDVGRGKNSPIERACDLFSGCLLMPEPVLREWWNDLRHNAEHREEVIQDRFGVTASALRVRLTQLGFIG